MLNRLGRLTPFKHHLNDLNAKQRVTDCVPYNVLENIDCPRTLRDEKTHQSMSMATPDSPGLPEVTSGHL